MPKKDLFHDEVREALEKDGWEITDDPLFFRIGKIAAFMDLAAEKPISAEKEGKKIVVEIKSFTIPSFITAFYSAVGKFITYRKILNLVKDDRELYLAMPLVAFNEYKDEKLVKAVFTENKIKVLVYNQNIKEIISWINY